MEILELPVGRDVDAMGSRFSLSVELFFGGKDWRSGRENRGKEMRSKA